MVYVIFAFLLLCCLADSGFNSISIFEEFKAKYEKRYSSPEEEKRRTKIFMSNIVKAEEMNRLNPHAQFGMTKFSDLSEEEFKSIYLSGEQHYARRKLKDSYNDTIKYTSEEVAASCTDIDWREKGAVTPIKDQKNCGCCWAFSSTGNIEGQWFLAGHPLVSLSEQELVSCDKIDHNCSGGLQEHAFRWLIKNRKGRIVTERSFSYLSGNKVVPACPANLNNLAVGAVIKSYKYILPNEHQMATFVCKSGPLAVAVDASSWHLYKGGVVTNCRSVKLGHAVLVVGFDKNNDPPYWIIKNTWGTNWGENGYIRIEYGSNQCLIKQQALTAIINGTNAIAFTKTTTSYGFLFLFFFSYVSFFIFISTPL